MKTIFKYLFCLTLLFTKGSSLLACDAFGKAEPHAITKKNRHYDIHKNDIGKSEDSDLILKRRYKPKCREAGVLHISTHVFTRHFAFHDGFSEGQKKSIYISPRHFWHKRGPPQR